MDTRETISLAVSNTKDMGLELVTDAYYVWSKHKFVGTIFIAFTLFAYAVAILHINDFLPFVKFLGTAAGVPGIQ